MSQQDELRAIRETLGLSQAAFAKLVGVTQPTIWRWETGRARIPVAAMHLARSLSATTDAA